MSHWSSSKDFEVIHLEPGQPVDLRNQGSICDIRPVKMWVLPTGSVTDKTSYAVLCVDVFGGKYVAQISEEMLARAWAEKTVAT